MFGICARDGVITITQTLQRAGGKGFQENIRLADQTLHDLTAGRHFQIDAKTALVPVDDGRRRAAVCRTEVIAARRFNLDDIGAYLGQQHGGERPREGMGHIEDFDIC